MCIHATVPCQPCMHCTRWASHTQMHVQDLHSCRGHLSIDVITHIPILCEDSDIPYIYVPSKEARSVFAANALVIGILASVIFQWS